MSKYLPFDFDDLSFRKKMFLYPLGNLVTPEQRSLLVFIGDSKPGYGPPENSLGSFISCYIVHVPGGCLYSIDYTACFVFKSILFSEGPQIFSFYCPGYMRNWL